MKRITWILPILLLVGCERPVTEPVEFARLCGPMPTQQEAEIAVKGCVYAAFRNPESLSIKEVVILGRTDYRQSSIGARVYGWKITFYTKTQEQIQKNSFTPRHYLAWNNGTVLGYDYAFMSPE